MSSWISSTASMDLLSGVSCVLRIGVAVLTSTSHSVSELLGISYVLVCTCDHGRRQTNVESAEILLDSHVPGEIFV